MAENIAIFRIMPDEPNAEEKIKASLKKIKLASLKDIKVEPFAFGINAVIAAFVFEEKEGALESLEQALKNIPKVSDVRLEHVSRI